MNAHRRAAPRPPAIWYTFPAATVPLLRPGQYLAAGTQLGAAGGRPLVAEHAGRIDAIHYDLDRDELILELEPEPGG